MHDESRECTAVAQTKAVSAPQGRRPPRRARPACRDRRHRSRVKIEDIVGLLETKRSYKKKTAA